jgi:uncharacterized protein YggE
MSRNGLLLLAMLVPSAALAQEQTDPPTISIDATATIEREPDRAVVTLAVESEGTTALAASQANAATMERVLAALRRTGLTGTAIRTVSLQLHPVYSGTGGERDEAPKIAGYRAINMVQVTVDTIARVGPVIDAGTNAGANRVAGISFELKDAQAAREEALTLAVEKAKREAEIVARAAGRTIGEPISITLSSPMYPPRPMYAARGVAMEQMASTPVEGGTLEISATVHVVFRLNP